jgi:FKBP-type peptidyl-prolyl cis-trans isomerase SlyD
VALVKPAWSTASCTGYSPQRETSWSRMPTDIISAGCVVSIAYTLESAAGVVYDDRADKPICYLHGEGLLVPGLEKALDGRSQGDEFSVKLGPDAGFGHSTDSPIRVYQHDVLADKLPLKVGAPLFADITKQNTFSGWITRIDDDGFTVDENHPLVDQEVVFHVRVIAIRSATPAELADGYAHEK